jgi:endoglycosylceramidase
MEPKQADLYNLQPFYDHISPTIRAADPDRLIFFESVTWADILEDGFLGIGFEHVPGGVAQANNSVLSFHYYDPPNFSYDGPKGYMQRRLEAASALGCGAMLTEFDLSGSQGQETTEDDCDDLQISWIGKISSGVLVVFMLR